MNTRRGAIASVAIALVFIGAGCATSSSTHTSTTSTTSTTGPPAQGITADTIKVAFTYPDLEALAKTGLIKLSHGSYPDALKALVDDINANGGINGRKLEVLPEKVGLLASGDALATCTKVTEDEKVFMVLGGFAGNDGNECVVQQHATPLLTIYGSGFNQVEIAKAHAPWVTPSASDERSVQALVQTLREQAILKGKTIGLYGGSASSKPLVDQTRATLTQAGYVVKDTALNDAPPTDAQALSTQDKVIAAKFKSEGIDAVFVLFTYPPGTNFDAVDYHPDFYSPQSALVSTGAFTNPYAKFPSVLSLGPSADPDYGYNSPEMKRCRQIWTKATGQEIQSPIDEQKAGKSTSFNAMSDACTVLRIFVDAAKAAGPNLTPETWQKGLNSLGTIQIATGYPVSFGPNKPDGQDSFQLLKFNPQWKSNSDVQQMLPLGNQFTIAP
jgi:hypothetical protein